MRFDELRTMLSEDETSDARTYEAWKGSKPISRSNRRYDVTVNGERAGPRVLKDDDLVRVWRVVRKGDDPSIYPGSWVSAHTEYLDEYAGSDWNKKDERGEYLQNWVTAEIPASELVDAQTGSVEGDTLIFIPKEGER